MRHLFDPPIKAPHHAKSNPETSTTRKRKLSHVEQPSPHARGRNTRQTAKVHFGLDNHAEADDGHFDPNDPTVDYSHAPIVQSDDDDDNDVAERGVRGPPTPAVKQQQRNVKHQHLLVLNTVLHKSLLAHDFPRARHAFALLLRCSFPGGLRLDLRKHGLWGIAAELLQRQPHPQPQPRDPAPGPGTAAAAAFLDDEGASSPDDHDEFDGPHDGAGAVVSAAGFRAARALYERLILQYPYRRTRPQDVSAQHFYPALFGLWILEVQALGRRVRASPDGAASLSSSLGKAETSSDSGDEEDGGVGGELRGARAVAGRLDEVLFVPPFDRDAQLLKLRGMVALWIGDLVTAEAAGDAEKDVEVRELRSEARSYLRRARRAGWKGWKGLEWVMDEDGEMEVEAAGEEW